MTRIALPTFVSTLVLAATVTASQPVSAQGSTTSPRRQGEFMLGLGVPFGTTLRKQAAFSYGAAVKLAYEMEQARIDGTILFQTSAGTREELYLGAATVEAHYLFLRSNVTPYVGGGLGYCVADDAYTSLRHGLVFDVVVGVELFRLYSLRLLFDVRVGFPSFELGGSYVPLFASIAAVVW